MNLRLSLHADIYFNILWAYIFVPGNEIAQHKHFMQAVYWKMEFEFVWSEITSQVESCRKETGGERTNHWFDNG